MAHKLPSTADTLAKRRAWVDSPVKQDFMSGRYTNPLTQIEIDEIVEAARKRGVIQQTKPLSEFTDTEIGKLWDWQMFTLDGDDYGYNNFGMWAYRQGVDAIKVNQPNESYFVVLNPSSTATSRKVTIGQGNISVDRFDGLEVDIDEIAGFLG